MAQAIDGLRADHANMSRLFDLLDREMAVFHEGDQPNFDLLLSLIAYMSAYPDACHHPKEDLVVERLRRRDAEAARSIDPLIAQHTKGARLTREFAELLDNVVHDVEVPRETFERMAREFSTFNRSHIAHEEADFFPLAEKLLTEADWAEIDAAIAGADPLFGPEIEEHYRALRESLTKFQG